MNAAKSLRRPDVDETGLSAEEIEVAIKLRLVDDDDELDLWPPKQRFIPAGWGIRSKGLRYAHPFDGLAT
jgi:hypothetical protein